MTQSKEFYIGYLPVAPSGVGRFMRRGVLGVVGIGMVVGVLAVVNQRPFAPASFDYTNPIEFAGTFMERPVPALAVRASDESPWVSRYLLTVPGKYGADAVVSGRHGRAGSLSGTLIFRDGMTMIEVDEPTVSETGLGLPLAAPVSHGTVTVFGEIVDGKCYLGVMNPGQGKPHRACAARCISGGAPPILVVGDETGVHRHLVMTGHSVGELLPLVAKPVEVTGDLLQSDGMWFIHVTPGSVRSEM